MNYELAKQLKKNGFPTRDLGNGYEIYSSESMPFVPNLSELIEACGEEFVFLVKEDDKNEVVWTATADIKKWKNFKDILSGKGSTPEEAVAKLWLELNKK